MARIGKYEILDLLGKGGMGEVWRARDEGLGRVVALKLLQRGGPEDVARFKREARVVARLSHPNIAQLFEVGDEPPHIAMQYVAGVPIHQAPLTLRAKAKALAEAARAVQHAHEQGVIHRDLKPANVLVDGAGRGMVLDFGLAREVEGGASSMSLPGDILGTPSYMAPEQARGDIHALDVRTDVYGLGAILYALLAGRPPFTGDAAFEVIAKVVRDDPPRPGGDRDLETVCLKAMEKEPSRRYATAAEFAADLERYAAGEPVAARRPGVAHRLARRIRRRPAIFALAGALVVVTGIAASVQWFTRREHGRELAEERLRRYRTAWGVLTPLAAQVDGIEDLRNAYGVPPARVEPVVRPILDQAEALIRDQPDFGPAVAWKARGLELLGRNDEAEREYDRACALSAESAEAWFLRGLYRVGRYQASRKLPSVTTVLTGVEFDPQRAETEAERAFRAGALADLARMADLAGLDPEFAQEKARLGRATLAVFDGRYETAIEEIAGDGGPRAGMLRGLSLYYLKRFAEASEAFAEVTARWPGSVDAWHHRGLAAGTAGHVESRAGRPPQARYEEAVRCFGAAIALNPTEPDFFNARGNCRAQLAEWKWTHAEDPVEDARAAIEDFARALALDPGHATALNNRGNVHRLLGQCDGERGDDPTEEFRAAIDDFSAALALRPGEVASLWNRAVTWRNLADWRAWHGGEAGEAYRSALEDLGLALSASPGDTAALDLRASVWGGYGEWLMNQGEDPMPAFARGIEDAEESIRLAPETASAFAGRGLLRGGIGMWRARSGTDPSGDYEAAVADLGRAISLAPHEVDLLRNRGTVLGLHAEWTAREAAPASEAGLRAAALYRRAIADFEAYLAALADAPTAEAVRRSLERCRTAADRLERGVEYR